MTELSEFQREVIDRLARIETRLDAMQGVSDRVTTLERGEHRRATWAGFLGALPGALAALAAAAWASTKG